MSEKTFDDGGNAFPNVGDGKSYDGMTLWDYFAAHALAGGAIHVPKELIAEGAAEIADAMLAERRKRMEGK